MTIIKETKSTNMNIKVNPDVKERALIVLNDMGVSLYDLFNMLLNQIAIQHKIPFDLVDSKYVCPYWHLHDYSNISPSDESEFVGSFNNLDDLWESLEI